MVLSSLQYVPQASPSVLTTKCTDRSFDLIVSTEVIERLENPRVVAREFARLMCLGGRLILTTPNLESARSC